MYRVIRPKPGNSTAPGVTANHDTSIVKSAVTIIADTMLGDKDAVQLVARSNEDGLETARTRKRCLGQEVHPPGVLRHMGTRSSAISQYIYKIAPWKFAYHMIDYR